MEPIKPFFVVLSAEDSRLKRHDDPEVAEKEAIRLAVKEGKRFYVLCVVDVLEPTNEVKRLPLAIPSLSDLLLDEVKRNVGRYTVK